ncbi:MAG: ABC transporter permease, partial [Chloroflexi bacterium]
MQWGRQFRRVLRSTVVVIGGLVALLIVGTALFANSLAPNPPDEQN